MRPVRILRALRIVLVIICLLVVLAVVVVHTPPVRRYAINQVVALLAREQIEFSTDELGYNVLNASVNLRNVRVRSTSWPDAPAFATIGRLRINLGLLQLLRGRYVVQAGMLEDVDVHYVVDESGRDNLPRPPRDPNAPSRPLNYLVSSLTIRNASVRYENRAQDIDARLPLSTVTVSGNPLTDRHQIEFDAANGDARAGERKAAIDRLVGQVDLGKDDVSFERVLLEAAGSRAEVTGAIGPFDAPVLDLQVKSTVDAMRAAEVAAIGEPLNGAVDVTANVRGPLQTLAINVQIAGSGLQVRDLGDVQLTAAAAYDVMTRQATVSALEVRGPWGGVTGTGQIAFDRAGQSAVDARIQGLDAGTVMRSLRLPFIAATRIEGTVRVEFPGLEYLRANGTADATFRPTAPAAGRSTLPLGGRITARGTGGRIDAQFRDVTVPGAEVDGRIAIASNRGLQGQLTGGAADVARLISSIEAFTGRPRGSLLPTSLSGAAMVEARLGGTLDSPTAATVVQAPALTVGTVDGVVLDAELLYTPQSLSIDRADVAWQQARVHVDGQVGLERGQPLALSVSGDNLEVTSILQAMNVENVPVSGTFNARGNVGGTAGQPSAAFTAQGSDLVAYAETIGTLAVSVDLEGRDLTVSRLVLDKPQPGQPGQLSLTGSYHLDRRTYTFDLQSHDLRLVGLELPGGQRLSGDIERLAGSGSGSVDSPGGTLDLDFGALQLEPAASTADPAAPVDAIEARTLPPTELGRVTIRAVAEDGEATIDMAAEHFDLDADATIGLMRPWPATVTVRADNLDLATLPVARPPNLSGLAGQLRATVDASGNLSDPAQGRASVNLEALDGSWNGRPFTVTSPSPLRYADERLTVDALKVAADDVALTLTGELPLTDDAGEGTIAVDLQGSLATLMQFAPPDTNIAADGAVTLDGSLRGTLKRIDPDLTLTVDNGLVLTPQLEPGFSNIVLRARVREGEADIERLEANWGTASLHASGRVPLDILPELPVEIPRMSGPATFKAGVTGLDPSAIPGAPPQLSGRISVEADVTAASADLGALDGQVTFQELDVAFGGLGLAQKQTSTVAIASGVAEIQPMNLAGSAGDLTTGGRIELVGDRDIAVNVDGTLNIAALSIFTDRVRAEGETTLNVLAAGTLSSPEVSGTVEVINAIAVSDEPNVVAENLNARVDLDGRRLVLTRLEGDVNGGTLNGSGSLTFGEGTVSEVSFELTANDVAYDAPLDLRSISDSNIRVTTRGDDILIAGQVTLEEGGLTGDINFDTGLLAAMTARRNLDLTEERDPLLERVRFDINVDTATPIVVDNNLARAEIEADLRVVGTPYETGLLGQITLLEGSEVRLNERRYEAERGIINFIDERRIFPEFDLRLNTTASNYDVIIAVNGTPGDTETTLTSSPTLPEPDIMALLVTGRTLDDMRGEEYEVARNQVLSYLAGRVGSTLGRGIQRATGFSEVRIEPTLIASEADPSARLTVGQEVTDDLKLVYSTNLTDSNDQIWVAEYDVTRRFQTRGVRQEDNSYRFDFRHDVRFGGEPEPRREARQRAAIGEVAVVVPDSGDEAAVRSAFGVKAGDGYDFFKIRNGVQQIERSYLARGYLQSRVRLERRFEGERVFLTLRVLPGPLVDLQFTGPTPPGKIQDQVRTQWHRGVFDKQRGDDGADALREWLMGDNFLQARVEYRIEEEGDRRRVVFQMEPGARSRRVVLAFEGASGVDPDELNQIVNDQQLERQLFTDPLVVTALLERYYREQGFLSAKIDEPRYEFQGDTARVVLAVEEGSRFSVRNVSVAGLSVYTTDAVIGELPVVAGGPFVPAAAENALEKIRDLYWSKGYNDVRSDYELVIDHAAAQVDLAFTVAEGLQSVIASITIEGNRRVSNRLVRQQIQLTPAEPLDLGSLARSRRNLYNTGAFSVVDITRREPDAPQDPGASLGIPDSGEPAPTAQTKPVEINVQLREVQPIQIRYGASYDTERGIGGIFDISNHNSLGGAREIGLRSRYDRQLHDVRLYVNQPALRYLPETTATIYLREELNPPTELTDPFDVSRKGVSIQQERKLRNAYVWTYGYRYERAHTLTPSVDGVVIDEALSVSPLTSTFTRETRDEVLDASRGSFLSQAFSFSPSWLGSDVPYIKYFGQYFYYVPLQSPRRKPFTNEVIRPRLVFATGVRLGLAGGIGGGPVPRTERFFAGGSATMRGFEQSAVGPIGLDRQPLGGQALLVLNNELRVPLVSLVDGVLFADIGNVFPFVRDFSLTDLRKSAGVGVRVRTPWLLLRGDYGIVLDPRPGEPRSRFYFSIGQAF